MIPSLSMEHKFKGFVPNSPNRSTISTQSRTLKSMLSTQSNCFNRTISDKTTLSKNHASLGFPTISEQIPRQSPKNSSTILTNSITMPSQRKPKHKILTLDQQEKLLLRSEWRELSKYQMFEDYLRVRDANGLKQLKREQTEEVEKDKEKTKQKVFSTDEQEKEYQEEQRKKNLEKAKESLQQPNLTKFSFFEGDDSIILSQKREMRLLHECFKTIEKIKSRLMFSQMETIQPLCDDLVTMFSHFGLVNFYLLSMFLNSLILQSYGRSKISYSNWKKYLRVCNVQGLSHHKYKLVGYKHISKCCLDIGRTDKALIYLKKMLKLSWVVDDRNYELLSYDMVSVLSYYKRELGFAQFFHEKFVNGDYEDKYSIVRVLGEQNYLYNQQLKDHIMDKNSYSEDDFDLDTIIQKSNLEKWAKEQKEREKLKSVKQQGKLTFYKKGISFAKFDDQKLKEHLQQKKHKILRFSNKWSEHLGPIYRKQEGEQDPVQRMQPIIPTVSLMNRNSIVPGSNVPVLINHQSPLRRLTQYLSQREQSQKVVPEDDEVVFKPIEQVRIILKLLNVFQFDLRYYSRCSLLYQDPSEL